MTKSNQEVIAFIRRIKSDIHKACWSRVTTLRDLTADVIISDDDEGDFVEEAMESFEEMEALAKQSFEDQAMTLWLSTIMEMVKLSEDNEITISDLHVYSQDYIESSPFIMNREDYKKFEEFCKVRLRD